MGTADRALSVSRLIPAPPKAVLPALGAVFTGTPHEFTLLDTVNGHPLDGGIMRFKVPRLMQAYTNPLVALAPDRKLRYRLEQIELFDLNVTLHARGSAAAPACEVVITGDLRDGLRMNMKWDYGIMAGVSALAMPGAAAGAAALLGSPALSLVPLLGAAGAGVLASTAVGMWYRWLFRGALTGAMDELQGLLLQVERRLTQQALFSGEPESASGFAPR
jgi:hypothetical protein